MSLKFLKNVIKMKERKDFW